jgi:RimJ/RimL family protein N-acetyltransferase
MIIGPVTLRGNIVQLVPLEVAHVPELATAGRDESIWALMPYGLRTTEARMAEHIREALEGQAEGFELAFAVIHQASGLAIGCTRYLDIRPAHRALEIGGTWYAVDYQRTGVNTECKLLLLRHAFEALGCVRVQLKTDLRNERSQRATERIGGVREGVLRKQMILPDGHQRWTVMYSILDEEWPAVKSRLQSRLRGA